MLRKRFEKSSGRLVPIRQLAEFSEDPKAFDKHRGKIRNKAAVRAGNRGEAALGKTGSVLGPIVIAAIVGLIVWMSL